MGPLCAELARILPGGEEEEKEEEAPPASARRAGELRCGGAGGESERGALPGSPGPAVQSSGHRAHPACRDRGREEVRGGARQEGGFGGVGGL